MIIFTLLLRFLAIMKRVPCWFNQHEWDWDATRALGLKCKQCGLPASVIPE